MPSSNCKEGESDYFQVLRFGVDSLYLSYAGEMFPAMRGELQRLKEIAQSPEEYQQATAQHPVGEHVFKVQDKGARLFPFILEDKGYCRLIRTYSSPLLRRACNVLLATDTNFMYADY